jgi:hypothetical protein
MMLMTAAVPRVVSTRGPAVILSRSFRWIAAVFVFHYLEDGVVAQILHDLSTKSAGEVTLQITTEVAQSQVGRGLDRLLVPGRVSSRPEQGLGVS